MRSLDLNLLVSLDALLTELNVTRAAQRLHISQPALSAQLSRLRSLFGDPLLMPAEKGRGMVATQRALALQAPLHVLLHEMETLLRTRPGFDPANDTRNFNIAASDNATIVAGVPLAEMLKREAGPGVRLAFRTVDQNRIADQMESGDIDVLFGARHAIPPSMKTVRLLHERFIMAQRKGHPRGTAALDMDSYCALEHMLVSTSGGSFHGFIDEHLDRLGRQRRVAISVQQFILVAEVLQATDYVSTLPGRLVTRHADKLDGFELPFEVSGYTLFMAWHPRLHADPGHVWLRELVLRSLEAR